MVDGILEKLDEIRTHVVKANAKLDNVADQYSQPLLDSRLTGVVYAVVLLGAIMFGAVVF